MSIERWRGSTLALKHRKSIYIRDEAFQQFLTTHIKTRDIRLLWCCRVDVQVKCLYQKCVKRRVRFGSREENPFPSLLHTIPAEQQLHTYKRTLSAYEDSGKPRLGTAIMFTLKLMSSSLRRVPRPHGLLSCAPTGSGLNCRTAGDCFERG